MISLFLNKSLPCAPNGTPKIIKHYKKISLNRCHLPTQQMPSRLAPLGLRRQGNCRVGFPICSLDNWIPLPELINIKLQAKRFKSSELCVSNSFTNLQPELTVCKFTPVSPRRRPHASAPPGTCGALTVAMPAL